jgi:hypothetical protein
MSDRFDPLGSSHKDDLVSDLIDLSDSKIVYTDKCDDPIADHLLHYSELRTSNLESKPITEKMDYWYLDLKKNFQVKRNISLLSNLID